MENSKKSRFLFAISLAILGVLVSFALIRPATASQEYSEVSRGQLLQIGETYIVQFDIVNHEGESRLYSINVSDNGSEYSQDVMIPNDKKFTYVHHFFSGQLANKDVGFTVYKEGEAQPFEQITYHLKYQV